MTISIRSLLFIFTANADTKGYSSTLHVNFFSHSLCLSVKNNLQIACNAIYVNIVPYALCN